MTSQRSPRLSQLERQVSVLSSSTTNSLLSDSTTTTSVGTLVGPGSIAGKAIYRLGKITLKGVEQVVIYRRLSTISSHFPHQNSSNVVGMQQMYEDLLELSRPGMYSNGIRLQALNILLVQIGGRYIRHLLAALSQWPLVEVGHLIADLAARFDPVALSFATEETSRKDTVFTSYKQSLQKREEHSFTPIVDFLSHLVSLDEARCHVVLESGVLDMLLGLYITDFRDFLSQNAVQTDPSKKSSLSGVCSSLFLNALQNGGLEIIEKHNISVLWSHHPALPFLNNSSNRRRRRKPFWDVTSPDYRRWRVSVIHDMMASPASDFDEATLLDALADCFTIINLPGMEEDETSYRALRALYAAVARTRKPILVSSAVSRFLSEDENWQVTCSLNHVIEMLLSLLAQPSGRMAFFSLKDDPPTLLADALVLFINCYTSIAREGEEYHRIVTGTGIIRLAREALKTLEVQLAGAKLASISDLLMEDEDDLKLYSSTYETHSLLQPDFIHVIRWDLIILERWRLPRQKLLCPPPDGWPVADYKVDSRQICEWIYRKHS